MDVFNLYWMDATGIHIRLLVIPGIETFMMTVITAILLRRLIQG